MQNADSASSWRRMLSNEAAHPNNLARSLARSLTRADHPGGRCHAALASALSLDLSGSCGRVIRPASDDGHMISSSRPSLPPAVGPLVPHYTPRPHDPERCHQIRHPSTRTSCSCSRRCFRIGTTRRWRLCWRIRGGMWRTRR